MAFFFQIYEKKNPQIIISSIVFGACPTAEEQMTPF